MIRCLRLCKVVGRPAAAVSRARERGERASSTAPTSKTEAATPSPNTRSAAAPLEGAGGTGGFALGRTQWRPSEAHKTSATAIRREKAAIFQSEVEGTGPVAAGGGLETRPAGLRRRALLGGAKEEQLPPPPQQQQQKQRVPGWSAFLATASCESSSVASMSATQRFRRKRELERLAATGSLEAVEALRASEAAPESAREGGGAESEGGLTPLTVLSVLLVVVAAGYGAAMNGLLPSKWLPSIGDGSGGFGGARSEGQSDRGEAERGDNEGSSRPSGIIRGNTDAGVDEQQRPRASRKASPVLKTIASSDPGDQPGCSADGQGPRDDNETRQRPPLWLKFKDWRAPEPPRSS